MNKIRFTLKAFAFLAFALACATATQAQATRTWVSGVGDDVNPCSRTAPCKTFAGAISKTADGGEIDCIDPGGFGTVTITKSITIDGGGTFGSILAAGTNGVNVNDSASGAPMTKIVRLRNISINGANTGLIGINYTSGKALYVENCAIYGFKAGSGHGINVNLTADGGLLFVRDTNIAECLTDGIRVTTSAGTVRARIENTRADHCLVGFHGMQGSSTIITHSSASSNNNHGVQIETAGLGANAVLDHCTFANNTLNGLNSGGGSPNVRLGDCTIVNNGNAGVAIGGGTTFTFGDNKIRNNGAGGTNNVTGGSLNTTETKQ